VYFKEGRVTGWYDGRPSLRVLVLPSFEFEGLTTFTVGSTKSEVVRIQGLPTNTTGRAFYYGASVVYFDREDDVTFTEAELTVLAYAKHPDDATVLACYCFAVSVGAMSDAARSRELREMVAHEVQAGHCACEVKNPKSACCLGDLVRIERAEATSTTAASCCAV